mmetsp:Transcript_50857/g.158923  ORF Transcript_50857/g.158923 Transcript_50857/m.158923 type:complete len:300 (-) Transcript_50857:1280-2179(-)
MEDEMIPGTSVSVADHQKLRRLALIASSSVLCVVCLLFFTREDNMNLASRNVMQQHMISSMASERNDELAIKLSKLSHAFELQELSTKIAIKLLKSITTLAFNQSVNQTNFTVYNSTGRLGMYANESYNKTEIFQNQGNISAVGNESYDPQRNQTEAPSFFHEQVHSEVSTIPVNAVSGEARKRSELQADIAAWPKSDDVWQGPLKIIERDMITCIDDSSNGGIVANYRPASYCLKNPTYCMLYCRGNFADKSFEPTREVKSQYLAQKRPKVHRSRDGDKPRRYDWTSWKKELKSLSPR